MKTLRNETTPKNNQLLYENLKKAALNSKKLTPASQSAPKTDAKYLLIKDLKKMELLTNLANSRVSRAVRIATIASINDISLLVDIATGEGPTFIKRDALLRIDELVDESTFESSDLNRLVSCLNDKELVAFTVVIMDRCDYDWCTQCDEHTVGALCLALYESTSIHETILLEDAIAHLSHSRKDLERAFAASGPDSFFMKSTYVPAEITRVMYGEMPSNNVA